MRWIDRGHPDIVATASVITIMVIFYIFAAVLTPNVKTGFEMFVAWVLVFGAVSATAYTVELAYAEQRIEEHTFKPVTGVPSGC